jgi:peptidoglycan/LPS O-acetylase OafA/YrhL
MSDATEAVTKEKTKTQRGDIQGLRALAVILVLLAHASVPGFAGGFIGVDVFFVISGFLITGLLLGDIAKHGKVRFGHFYARRASRILPAATLVIVVTAIASTMILGVLQARSTMTDSLWAVFFAANIHFAAVGTNYFASPLGTSPLMHYWSLAVEEQFYLVWPAIIALVALVVRAKKSGRVPRLSIGAVLVVISAVSLYLSVDQTANNPTGAYFSTLDRAWELGVGALLAIALPVLTKAHWGIRSALSWAGVSAIALSVILFNASTPIPGWRALLPVLGSAAILFGGVGSPRWSTSAMLSVRPARFVGDISYSLYLWHFPILILGAAYFGRHDSLGVRFALLGGAVALSSLSYHGLENPVRHAKMFVQKTYRAFLLWPVAVGTVVATVAIATPTVAFAASTGSIKAVPVAQAVATAVVAGQDAATVPLTTTPGLLAAPSDHVDLGACDAYDVPNWHLCNLGDPHGTKTVVAFGNSHSAMWVPAISAAAKADGWKFYPVVREACAYEVYPDLGGKWGSNNICTKWYDVAKADIKRLHPNVLIIGSYTNSPEWAAGERTDINQLGPLVGRVILLSDTTKIPSPAECLLANGATQKSCLWPVSATRANDTVIASDIAAATHSEFINVTPWFCDNGLCPSVINGIIPFFDGAHLTPQYSTYLGPAMTTALNLNGGSVIQPSSVSLSTVPPVTTTTTSTPGS